MGNLGGADIIIIIVALVFIGGSVYSLIVWFQAIARSKHVSHEALTGQAKAIAMEERHLAMTEELLTLHRETNSLLRQLVDRIDSSGRG